MGSYVYLSSLSEFLRVKRIWPWLLLAIAGMLLAMVWPHLNNSVTPKEQYVEVTEKLVFHVLALASAIFTSAVVSQEVEQKTIVYLLTRPVPRWTLLLGRYFASATVVAALGILGLLFVSIGSFGPNPAANPLLGRDIAAMICGALAYGGLFLLLSLLINRAMMVCLLFAFGWETIVPHMPGEMHRLSVNAHLMAIADHPTVGTGGPLSALLSPNPITPSSGYLTLLVAATIFVSVSAAWFTRGEYVPREDAE